MPKIRGTDGKYKPITGLSNEQSQAIFMIVYGDYKYNKDIYEELNIPKSTYYHWFTQDLFTEELQKARQAKWKAMSGKALKKLDELIDCENSKVSLDACKTVLQQNNDLNDKLDISQNISKELKITFFDGENDEENEEE